ncbi:MAG: FAD-dependent oxidoreductase [Chloroflexi bacterium]|nr:FAD-dependent oxidoreductase [Chloroflexota bacterium]
MTGPMTDVAVVGAGAVGLTLAARLAQRGASVTLFEASDAPERVGSRAICMQRETLEIWARLGIGDAVAERGIQWRIGRTYFRGRELFSVELPGATDAHFPPFVNISQSEVEARLVERAASLGVTTRSGHRLIGAEQDPDGVSATFATELGETRHRSSFLVGTDGAHSAVRHAIGMGFDGHTFDDRFLIADIRAELPFAEERHFHFDPPWNPGRQVLIHPQPDGVWRIDWQVPPETDAEAERANGRLDRRIRAVIGEGEPYELVWLSGYRFSQRIADAFRAGRIFLAGDAAHVMAPFGARGLNSGVADAENLAWKLALVLRGDAPVTLLDTYDAERRPAALDNLAATNATMRFMAPRGPLRRTWRDLVLRLAPRFTWFRRRVDSGRLAEPATYASSSIVSAGPAGDSPLRHGSVAPDVLLPGGGRLRDRIGDRYVAVVPQPIELGLPTVVVGRGSVYGDERSWLVRPDGYLTDSRPLDLAAEPSWEASG